MIDKMIIILEVFTYFALLPFVAHALSSINFTKVFKKDHIGEIRMVFFLTVIVITKITGDFFIDIMRLLLTLTGIINN